MSTNCPCLSKIPDLLGDRLTAAEDTELSGHVEQCADCQKEMELLAVAAGPRCAAQRAEAAEDHSTDFIRRLKDRPPATWHSAGPSPEAEKHSLSFLAPPQGPDELGRLGGYRVLGVLGRGGMGVVLEAEDPQLDRRVALKVLKPALAEEPSYRKRFLREARAAAGLENDHVVPIYQVGEDRGVPFLAMPRLKGQPLDHWLRGHRPTIPEALRIGREVARGLAAAHARGLVHRDIKPANVWLDADSGRARILDFGLARAATDVQLTQSGLVVGTLGYLSPEQARGERVDARSDLFSLGCLLYRLVAEKPPFRGDDTLGLLTALAVDTPQPLTELSPAVPSALADLVTRLLAKRPEARPQSAAEVADALQAIEQAMMERTLTNLPTGVPKAPVTPLRRRPAVRVALGFLAACVLLGGIILVIRHKDGTEKRIELPEGSTVRVEEDEKPPAPLPPLDSAWLQMVQAMKAEEQVREVTAEMRRRNPGIDEKYLLVTEEDKRQGLPGAFPHVIENGGVIEFRVPCDAVTDLSPVRTLPMLKTLICVGSAPGKGKLRDLSPLKGMKLPELYCSNTQVADLTPLAGMQLTYLDCQHSRVADLAPLQGMPLQFLNCEHTAVADLKPVRGMPLEVLVCRYTKVADLGPLKETNNLKEIYCNDTDVADLSPLRGLKQLTILVCWHSKVESLRPLDGMALRKLVIDFKAERDAALLHRMMTLETINNKPVAEFWEAVNKEK